MAKGFSSQLRGYENAPENMKKDPTFPIYELGYQRGKDDVAKIALDYLQTRFMLDEDRPEKGTPEYDYILKLTKNLAEVIRKIKLGDSVDN